jgi:hypothetical protein
MLSFGREVEVQRMVPLHVATAVPPYCRKSDRGRAQMHDASVAGTRRSGLAVWGAEDWTKRPLTAV